jgi:hypothetical protein
MKLFSVNLYEEVSKSFRTRSITKWTTITRYTHWEATQRVVVAKLTRMTHKIVIQSHLVAESCTICSSRSRTVQKLLDTPLRIRACSFSELTSETTNPFQHFARTPWMGDRAIARPLHTQDSTTQKDADIQPCSSGIRTHDLGVRAVQYHKR